MPNSRISAKRGQDTNQTATSAKLRVKVEAVIDDEKVEDVVAWVEELITEGKKARDKMSPSTISRSIGVRTNFVERIKSNYGYYTSLKKQLQSDLLL